MWIDSKHPSIQIQAVLPPCRMPSPLIPSSCLCSLFALYCMQRHTCARPHSHIHTRPSCVYCACDALSCCLICLALVTSCVLHFLLQCSCSLLDMVYVMLARRQPAQHPRLQKQKFSQRSPPPSPPSSFPLLGFHSRSRGIFAPPTKRDPSTSRNQGV